MQLPKSTARVRHALPAKARLIRTGESLIARNGIDAVSMREIAAAADCGDTNAVSYHFGSKDGLLAAIFSARIEQMDTVRARMFAQLENAGKLHDLLSLIGILLLPQLDLTDEEGRHPYASFLLHFATRRWSTTTSLWTDATEVAPNLRRVIQLLCSQLPDIPQAIVRDRILLCNMMLQGALVRWDNGINGTEISLDARIRDVMLAVRASLMATDNGEYIATSVDDWFVHSA